MSHPPHPPTVVIFDDGLGLLSPLTDLRPSFDVRTGALTLRERLERTAGVTLAAWHVPKLLEDLTRERIRLPQAREMRPETPVLFVNGRAPLPPREAFGLAFGHALVEERSRHIIAAHGPVRLFAQIVRSDATGLSVGVHTGNALLARPWDVRAFRDACIGHDLSLLLSAAGAAPQGREFVFRLAQTAKAHPSTIVDTERGHIFVDEHATIRPGAIIVGPAYVGPHSTVLERALIKSNTAIGPHCKVAGEVGGTIFQGYANKAHDGHLGDSWVGEWANLGAGTTNSNLLNTYGEVICRPLGPGAKPGPNERTGQQFLGATIGDHVKTAICTRIMTGAIVGTGTMFAASAPLSGTVPALSWITDSGTKPFAVEKFLEVAKAAMARRNLAPSEAYLMRVRELGPSRE